MLLDETQWQHFSLDGFLHLGPVLASPEVGELRDRADDLAMGRAQNAGVLMALDAAGSEGDPPGLVSGFDRGTLAYREIQGLEYDDVFRPLVTHPLFLEICARLYAPHAAISMFRGMVINKPAGQGTAIAWHQNGGARWHLDRDPLVTIWVALDDATLESGCVEAIRGSHRGGLLSADGGTLSQERAAIHCDEDLVVALEVKSGHAVLLHNWLIHRSGVNRTSAPRRAFSGCYMDGRTISVLTGSHFPVVAGTVDEAPYPYISQLETDSAANAESVQAAQEKAASLEAEVAELRERCEAAETQLRSLEEERDGANRAPRRLPNWLRSLFRQ